MIALIFADRCSGCTACVEACPTNVLDVDDEGIPIIARLEDCQTCFMCELYCASDAIYVGADQRAPEPVDPIAILASGELGSSRRAYRWTQGGSETGSLDQFWRLGTLLREGAETAARRYAVRHGTLA